MEILVVIGVGAAIVYFYQKRINEAVVNQEQATEESIIIEEVVVETLGTSQQKKAKDIVYRYGSVVLAACVAIYLCLLTDSDGIGFLVFVIGLGSFIAGIIALIFVSLGVPIPAYDFLKNGIKSGQIYPNFYLQPDSISNKLVIIDVNANTLYINDERFDLTNLKRIRFNKSPASHLRAPHIHFFFRSGLEPVRYVCIKYPGTCEQEYQRLLNFLKAHCGW